MLMAAAFPPKNRYLPTHSVIAINVQRKCGSLEGKEGFFCLVAFLDIPLWGHLISVVELFFPTMRALTMWAAPVASTKIRTATPEMMAMMCRVKGDMAKKMAGLFHGFFFFHLHANEWN